MTLTQLKYGMAYVVSGVSLVLGLLTAGQWYITQGDMVELLQGTIERCLATSTNGTPAQSVLVESAWFEEGTQQVFYLKYSLTNGIVWTSQVEGVGIPSTRYDRVVTTNSETGEVTTNLVESIVTNRYRATYYVTNSVGWYVDKDLFEGLADTTRALVTNYVNTGAVPRAFYTVTGVWDKLSVGDHTNKWGFELTNRWWVSRSNLLEVYRVLHFLKVAAVGENPAMVTTTVVTANGSFLMRTTFGLGSGFPYYEKSLGRYPHLDVLSHPVVDWGYAEDRAMECLLGGTGNVHTLGASPAWTLTPSNGGSTNFTSPSSVQVEWWSGSVTTTKYVNYSGYPYLPAIASATRDVERYIGFEPFAGLGGVTYAEIRQRVTLQYQTVVVSPTEYPAEWPCVEEQQLGLLSAGNRDMSLTHYSEVQTNSTMTNKIYFGPVNYPPTERYPLYVGPVAGWQGYITPTGSPPVIDIPGVFMPGTPWHTYPRVDNDSNVGGIHTENFLAQSRSSNYNQSLMWTNFPTPGDRFILSSNIFSYCTNAPP